MKKGFTLIELVMVIVILGIISMFGADLYSQIYRSYLHTRALNQLESRTQNAITLITNRLEYRVPGTTIGRIDGQPINQFLELPSTTSAHNILEWIGQSIETKDINNQRPGWSGFVDVQSIPTPWAAGNNNINSQGSNLTSVGGIISNLTCATRGCAAGRYNNFAVIFKSVASDFYGGQINTAFGYSGTNSAADRIFVADATVNAGANETLTITNYPANASGDREFSEQYYLVHSAYTIYPTGTANVNYGGQASQNFNLMLAYNYRPWLGETYNGATTSNALLAEDVFMFRLRDEAGSIAMKLCMRDNGRNFDPNQLDMVMCKSQVVY
ncbi:prepilin-type N-terminal cleavage/methylation domain-containing protein [Campylobacter sp. JMF_02 ED1]|uniref:type II secretion system protein n=1 Tax=unclassified Campylobacter TaxID=2593542 RepID=UPI0022E9EA9D|nr:MULTISPECIES: prepilin-type N-terminal cleavage/methylation domain-containing protein [unclassified Campylobacter]MDA3049527.1 prepilin-type N-terminal cleavage/methylation domain-containing protein [Campylobacter sp. JMF_15 NE4]MDA3051046.1 prepilin-type N-terminal cleavage/methylation domain-containing protein [Campylobacter sp. JMF_02 ED1]